MKIHEELQLVADVLMATGGDRDLADALRRLSAAPAKHARAVVALTVRPFVETSEAVQQRRSPGPPCVQRSAGA